MKQEMTNEEFLDSIVAKVKKENDGIDIVATVEIEYAMQQIRRAADLGEEEDLERGLYWLLDDTTKRRLENFSVITVGSKKNRWDNCKYLSDGNGIIDAIVKEDDFAEMDTMDSPTYLSLVSKANPDIRVSLEEPDSLEFIALSYNILINKVLDYYKELREAYKAKMYMAELLDELKTIAPNVRWGSKKPREIISAIKAMENEQ